MKKVSIVQFEAVHEEIIPSLDFYFRKAGYSTFSILNRKIQERRGDFFFDSGFSNIERKYVPIEKQSDWDNIYTELLKLEFEYLLLNTYQREGVVDWSLKFDKPILGVVHNPLQFLSIKGIENILKENVRIFLIGLAPHVAAYLIKELPFMRERIIYLDPIVWSENSSSNFSSFGEKIISIPGGVNYRNRDYSYLIKSINNAKNQGCNSKNIKIQILGGGQDRHRLEKEVSSANIEDFFVFSKVNSNNFVNYDIYLNDLSKSHFLLPLFKENDYAYRTYKISSVIPSSVGNEIPLLQDNWTSIVYGATGYTYESNQLCDLLCKISLIKPKEYFEIYDKIKKNYNTWESRSFLQLKILINHFNR